MNPAKIEPLRNFNINKILTKTDITEQSKYKYDKNTFRNRFKKLRMIKKQR